MTQRTYTSSEIREWKNCRLKWWFRYRELLVPKRPQEALSFGALIHAGAEAYYRGEEWRLAIGTYIREQDTPWTSEESLFVIATACALLDGYIKRDPVIRLGHTVESVEREFIVQLRGPAGRKYSRHLLAGKRDLGTRDSSGNLWLWDHKTAANSLDPVKLDIDDQMSYYLWADKQDGISACGIMYNLIRKPSIKPRKSEKPAEWGKRLAEDIESRPEFYYQQEQIVKSRRQMAQIQRDLWNLAHEIGVAPIYRNSHGTCSIFGCAYRDLCQNDSAAVRSAKFKIERPHSELQEVV